MSYQVTARKWRPMVFEDVVGQSHVTDTLRNALATDRVAHAYLFSGTRGCGKTTTARILARALNCLSPVNRNPDNTCEICQEIIASRSLDVIEIDGASNRGVEEIRNLRESVRYTPSRGKYKVYIIDEVHMLTKEAFNALLKTLEEPPSHVIFIFATTEVHKVPMTILSRCQRFDFRRIAIEEIIGRLRLIADAEQVTIDDDALLIIGKKGDGSLRDAQSIFDQVRSFCGNEIRTEEVLKALNVVDQEVFFRVSDLFLSQDVRGGIQLVDDIMKSGYDLREFVSGLSEHLRNLLIVQTTGSTDLVETSEPFRKRYQADSPRFPEADVLRLIKQTNDLEQSIRWAPQPRFKLEAALLQMIRMDSSVRIEDLLKQLDEFKKKLTGPATVRSAAPGLSVPTAVTVPAARSTSDVKVMGEVSAGRLRSAVAVGYASPRTAATPAVYTSPSVSASSAGPGITETQAASVWSSFVADVMKNRIAVGTTLSQSRLLDAGNGCVRIVCHDDYTFSTLKRHKEYLSETFQRLAGARVSVEPVLGSQDDRKSVITYEPKTVDHTAPSAPHGNGNHPMLAVLKRELGAEKVD